MPEPVLCDVHEFFAAGKPLLPTHLLSAEDTQVLLQQIVCIHNQNIDENLVRTTEKTKRLFGGVLHLSRNSVQLARIDLIEPEFKDRMTAFKNFAEKQENQDQTLIFEFFVTDPNRAHHVGISISINTKDSNTQQRTISVDYTDSKYNLALLDSISKKLQSIISQIKAQKIFDEPGYVFKELKKETSNEFYKKHFSQQPDTDGATCGFRQAASFLSRYLTQKDLKKFNVISEKFCEQKSSEATPFNSEIQLDIVRELINEKYPDAAEFIQEDIKLDNQNRIVCAQRTQNFIKAALPKEAQPETAATTATTENKTFQALSADAKKAHFKRILSESQEDEKSILKQCTFNEAETVIDEKQCKIILDFTENETVGPKKMTVECKTNQTTQIETWTGDGELSLEHKYAILAAKFFKENKENPAKITLLSIEKRAQTQQVPATDLSDLTEKERVMIRAFHKAGFSEVTYAGTLFPDHSKLKKQNSSSPAVVKCSNHYSLFFCQITQ